MLKDFFLDLEKTDNPTLIALLLIVIYKVVQLGLNTVTGFFRNDKTQFDFMRDLLQENIDTRRELAESNRELKKLNEETRNHIRESTAAMSYL